MNSIHRSTFKQFAFAAGIATCITSSAAAADVISESERRGMAAAWPAAMLVKSQASPVSSLKIKQPKDQASPPMALAGVSVSNPGLALSWLNSQYPAVDIEFDAISTGNGAFPEPNLNGLMVIAGTNRWLSFSASVSHGSDGDPSGLFADNGGSDIVGYSYESSSGLDPRLVGNSVMEMNKSNVGLGGVAGADISALDYALGMQSLDVVHPEGQLFQLSDRIYFSITKASAQALSSVSNFAEDHASWPVQNRAAHAADIYMMKWNSQSSSWDGPYQWAKHGDLGFLWNGDLDALEVNSYNGVVVYSPTRNSMSLLPGSGLDSQLMIVNFAPSWENLGTLSGTTPRSLKDRTGTNAPTKVSTRMQINDVSSSDNQADEVDAICGFDPEANLEDWTIGIARGAMSPIPGQTAVDSIAMGLSMIRTDALFPQNPLPTWSVQLTGWGGRAPAQSIVAFVVAYGNLNFQALPAMTSPRWHVVHVMPRTALDTNLGIDLQLRNNPNLPAKYALSAIQINLGTSKRTTASVLTFTQ